MIRAKVSKRFRWIVLTREVYTCGAHDVWLHLDADARRHLSSRLVYLRASPVWTAWTARSIFKLTFVKDDQGALTHGVEGT